MLPMSAYEPLPAPLHPRPCVIHGPPLLPPALRREPTAQPKSGARRPHEGQQRVLHAVHAVLLLLLPEPLDAAHTWQPLLLLYYYA